MKHERSINDNNHNNSNRLQSRKSNNKNNSKDSRNFSVEPELEFNTNIKVENAESQPLYHLIVLDINNSVQSIEYNQFLLDDFILSHSNKR